VDEYFINQEMVPFKSETSFSLCWLLEFKLVPYSKLSAITGTGLFTGLVAIPLPNQEH